MARGYPSKHQQRNRLRVRERRIIDQSETSLKYREPPLQRCIKCRLWYEYLTGSLCAGCVK